MAKSRTKVKEVSPPLYTGASECDLRPEWVNVPGSLLPLLEAAYRSDPEDMTVLLVLADALEEEGDGRAGWVRFGVRLWEVASVLVAGEEGWDEAGVRAALDPVVKTVPGWRVASLWGSLLAWHAPCGDGTGRVMGRTWVDERVRVVQRCVWFWGLGFLSDFGGGSAAWVQADAAWGQASAAGRQEDAAWDRVWKFARLLWDLCRKELNNAGKL